MEPSQLQANSSIHHNQNAEFTLFSQKTSRNCFTLTRVLEELENAVSQTSWGWAKQAAALHAFFLAAEELALLLLSPPLHLHYLFPLVSAGSQLPFNAFFSSPSFWPQQLIFALLALGPAIQSSAPVTTICFQNKSLFLCCGYLQACQ